MAARKTYETAKSEHAGETMEIVIDNETFVCTPWRLPPSLFLDISGIAITSNTHAVWQAYEAVFSKPHAELEGVVDKSEYTRFREFVDSSERRVTIELLGEIITDIYQEATGRPTTPSGS